jgi:hypothetical protein
MTAEFPEGFQGAGPMFAAVPLGDPWYSQAVRGGTSYVVEKPIADPGPDAEPVADGWAFLDRADAEPVADAIADGEYTRYDGLSGWYEQTPARDEADRQALAEQELQADLISEAAYERSRGMTDAEIDAEAGAW